PGMHISQQQRQTLVMTPQLQQSIKLLQMSAMDLQHYVEQQLEENPLLMSDDGELIASAGKEGEAEAIGEEIAEENRLAGESDFLGGEASEEHDVVDWSEGHGMSEAMTAGGVDGPDPTHWE